MSTFDTPYDGMPDSALDSRQQSRPANGAALVPTTIALDATRQAALPLAAIEQFRVLARRLDAEKRAGGPRALVVTSPSTGEGRTTTALYTAVALAGRGHRVVLCDFDLRRPELAARHDLPELPGIVEVVRGQADLSEALRLLPGAPGLTLLPAGEPQEDPAPIFFDPRSKQLCDALHDAFDFLVADSPPALGVADAACLADMLGGVLLVARSGKTTRRDLAAAASALRGATIVGCVLTGVEGFASLESRRAAEIVARRPVTLALARR